MLANSVSGGGRSEPCAERRLRPHQGHDFRVGDREATAQHQIHACREQAIVGEHRAAKWPATTRHIFLRQADGERHARLVTDERLGKRSHDFIDPSGDLQDQPISGHESSAVGLVARK